MPRPEAAAGLPRRVGPVVDVAPSGGGGNRARAGETNGGGGNVVRAGEGSGGGGNRSGGGGNRSAEAGPFAGAQQDRQPLVGRPASRYPQGSGGGGN